MKKDIKKMVTYYVKKVCSNNPFDIADYLNILVQTGNLGECSGCYMFLENHRYIFLDWLTAIITLFIGFFFTKLINPLLERLFSVFLQLGGTFVNSIADSTYREVCQALFIVF